MWSCLGNKSTCGHVEVHEASLDGRRWSRGSTFKKDGKLAWRAQDGCLRSISLVFFFFFEGLDRAKVKLCICCTL